MLINAVRRIFSFHWWALQKIHEYHPALKIKAINIAGEGLCLPKFLVHYILLQKQFDVSRMSYEIFSRSAKVSSRTGLVFFSLFQRAKCELENQTECGSSLISGSTTSESLIPSFWSEKNRKQFTNQSHYPQRRCYTRFQESTTYSDSTNTTKCEVSAKLQLFPYLLPSHVDQKLGAIRTEGDVRGHQDPQPVVVVWKLHGKVPCGEKRSRRISRTGNCCLCPTPAAPFHRRLLGEQHHSTCTQVIFHVPYCLLNPSISHQNTEMCVAASSQVPGINLQGHLHVKRRLDLQLAC